MLVFTERRYASAVHALVLCSSVRSVRLSATSRSSSKAPKRRITETTPRISPRISDAENLVEIPMGSLPMAAQNRGGVG